MIHVLFTMHFLGLEGMQRRIYDYPPALWTLNWLATLGAFILGFGQLFFVGNVAWTLIRGPVSDPVPRGEVPAQMHGTRVPGGLVSAMQIHGRVHVGSPVPMT